MRIIDFHTHTYPDAIAERTIAALSARSGEHAVLDGTRAGLLRAMAEDGVTASVVLPVATRPDQVRKINEKNAPLNGQEGLLYFGAIHPDCPDVEGELDFIQQAGFRGIKLHPDYQGTDIDDERNLRILAGAAQRDLIVVTHAGVDPGFPGEPVRCTPDGVLSALRRLGDCPGLRLVLAHMGGAQLSEEVLEKLAGQPLWLDTSFVLDTYPDKCLEIIRAHGASRVLFATDSPWRGQRAFADLLCSLPLTPEEKEDILHRNAERLLGFQP